MKVFNLLYQDFNQLSFWIEKNSLNPHKHYHVMIHTSILTEEESVALAKKLKDILPQSDIKGCSVTGIIYEGKSYSENTLISIVEFEQGSFFSKIQSTKNLKAQQIAESIAHISRQFETHFGVLIFDFSQEHTFEITNKLNELLPDVNFVGGLAGKLLPNGEADSYLFDEHGSYRESFYVNFISHDYVLNHTDIITGHPPISDILTITRSTGECIEEIDNIPAFEWFEQNLALSEFSGSKDYIEAVGSDILLRFPLVLEGYTSTTRFLRYDEDQKKLCLYATKLPEGQKFRLGYLSPLKSAEELQELCHNLQMISAEGIFCYSCTFRNHYSNDISNWELNAFKDSHIAGAFLLGEIGTKNNQVQFLNGSACFFTLAEKAVHIEPDLTVFDSIDSLLETNEDLEKLIHTVDKKLNSKVFNSFLEHEKEVKQRLLNIEDGEFKNISQFLKQQSVNKQEQICLIAIENFEEHFQTLGEEKFEELCKENREKVCTYLKKQYAYFNFSFYKYDFVHFFFTVEENISDTVFENIVKTLHKNLGKMQLLDESVSVFNNYTFTLDGLSIQKLLQSIEAKDVKLGEKRFNHFEKTNSALDDLNHEFQMVAALKEIIDTKAVVPYFQGIYDNNRNCFHMYEALMRLQHPNGKMLFPNDFMDIAKKYNLYLTLSLLMVKKVFELFKDREEIITLNISAYDILSEDFVKAVFESLREMKRPQNFVFELLETEAFTDLDSVKNFIHQVKLFGCKVAVDDFGAGYSNFIEFGNLDVDYLKLNGSLTKLLGTDFNYEHILNSIAFMGEKMHVKLIAEFVETAATQKLLIQSGVHYSQGYFFSKPMPFSELIVVSRENKAKIENQNEVKEEPEKQAFSQSKANLDNFFLYFGGFLVAFFTMFSLVKYVNYNNDEFKDINDAFLVELATGLADKVALFAEEAEISTQIISAAMSEYVENFDSLEAGKEKLSSLKEATKFNDIYVSYGGTAAINSEGEYIGIPIDQIYGNVDYNDVVMLPIMEADNGEKMLLFAANLYMHKKKVGEVYGTFELDQISSLLNLESFGGEAFYHISQVDGTPIYLSGRGENAFTSGDMYDFIGSLEIFNGHTSASIKENMYEGKTVLLNYYLKGEERSAVMVRVPHTDWCLVSIVLNEINTQMLRTTNRSTIYFITFIVVLYLLYFMLVAHVFRKHRNIILDTLQASQALSNSLQLSIEKDSLTGTYSRATAIEKISNVISTQNQKGIVHAMAILDIDNFKYINDTYGHHTGDIYLQSFVSSVKLALKPGNILGRLGGDEFLVLINDAQNMEEVEKVFDKLFHNIRQITLGGVDLNCVSVSAGIVMITENKKTYEELMIEADNTLYKAKREGKNKYLFA